MPVPPGTPADLDGVWTDHNTFHSEYAEDPDLPSETGQDSRNRQANAVLNQTKAAAETVLALLSDQDISAKTREELKSLASNLLVIAEFAHPGGCAFLKHETDNWLWQLWDTARVVDHEQETTNRPQTDQRPRESKMPDTESHLRRRALGAIRRGRPPVAGGHGGSGPATSSRPKQC